MSKAEYTSIARVRLTELRGQEVDRIDRIMGTRPEWLRAMLERVLMNAV